MVLAEDGVIGGFDDGGEPLSDRLGALAIGDVDQHVHGADQFPRGVEQGCRIGNEGDACSVRPLGYGFHAADGTLLLQRHRHGALVVLQRRAVGPIELPRTAEFTLAELRAPAPHGSGGFVVKGDPTSCVGDVNSRWQGADEVAPHSLVFAAGHQARERRREFVDTRGFETAGHQTYSYTTDAKCLTPKCTCVKIHARSRYWRCSLITAPRHSSDSTPVKSPC